MPKKGQVVRSLSGHDKGDLFVITASDEDYIYICDGKHRKLSDPKRKNVKHVDFIDETLSEYSMEFDSRLRKALSALKRKCVQ